jgi:hypothetical protein
MKRQTYAELAALLDRWAANEGVHFVNRSAGQYTTSTVSREGLVELMMAVSAAEHARREGPKPLTEGALIDVCLSFGLHADSSLSSEQYLVAFAAAVQDAVLAGFKLQDPGALEPQAWFESSEQKLSEERYCDGWNACRRAMFPNIEETPCSK